MKTFILSFLALLLIFFAMTFVCGGKHPSDQADAFVDWAKKNAISVKTVEPGSGFTDLEPLKRVIGAAHLVFLGESRHDTHEQARFKHRMIEFLVEKMGFSAFVLEESLPHAAKLNEFILNGTGDLHRLLNDLAYWFLWDTEEMFNLVMWMRQYNENPAHTEKLRFYGIDVVAPGLAVANVLAYLDRVDPGYSTALKEKPLGRDLFEDANWPKAAERYGALSPDEKAALKANYAGLVENIEKQRAAYIARSSEHEYEWALREALVAQAGNDMFSSGSRIEGGIIRDKAMADNLRWIMSHEIPGQRGIVWAHNVHIARDTFLMPGQSDERLPDVACHLSKEFGNDMVSIGGSFNRGAYSRTGSQGSVTFAPADSNSVDGVLARIGSPRFILDLRSAPKSGAAAKWLGTERRMQAQGFDVALTPARAYDAIYFVDSISQSKQNPLALERLGIKE
jgi:erythromycin esterase